MPEGIDRDRLEQTVGEIGARIGSACPPGTGFALMLFTYGEGGHMAWASSADRDTMIEALRETADVLEHGDASLRLTHATPTVLDARVWRDDSGNQLLRITFADGTYREARIPVLDPHQALKLSTDQQADPRGQVVKFAGEAPFSHRKGN